MKQLTHIFFDIGGVVLTNGWDHMNREEAAQFFNYDYEESDNIHANLADDFGTGRITREEYLDKVIFYKKRDFTKAQFIDFMESRSDPYKETFAVLEELRNVPDLKLATINDESLELNEYRIKHFELSRYFTNFFSSCYLGVKKPNKEIFERTLQITNADPAKCLFIDDRETNTEAAKDCGFQVIFLKRIFDLENILREKEVLK